MPSNVKLRHLIPALIALSTVTYGLYTSATNTRNNLSDSSKVAHSRHVIIALQGALRFMLELELKKRDFIISGDPSHLTSFEKTLRNVNFRVSNLNSLVRDNPQQQIKAKAITDIIAQRLKSIEETLARSKENPEAGIQILKNTSATTQSDQLRKLVDEMREEELMLLEKNQKKLEASLRQTNLTIFISDGIAIGAGALCAASLILFLSARDREEHLRIEKEKAENADRAKSEFLAVMSHEIRTPMNAILGFGELLNESVKTPREKHFAGAILSSGNALLSLINDILDLSKVEAGKLEIQTEPVHLAKFAESLETLFLFRAKEKALDFSVTISPGTPSRLSFDSLRLRQVIINLAGNAIKFTHHGSVSISIGVLRDAEDEIDRLQINVSDTGIGISKEHIHDVFRPFYQIDSMQNRQFQGTGLGLSISMRLIEAMGGEITVDSMVGEGSNFTVTIPTRQSQGKEDSNTLTNEPQKGFAAVHTTVAPHDARLVTTPTHFRELCTSLDNLHQTVWPELVKLIPAQGTIRFSARLTQLARKHDCPLLADHAMQLLESAQIMDFAESERLLRKFPDIISTLRSTYASSFDT